VWNQIPRNKYIYWLAPDDSKRALGCHVYCPDGTPNPEEDSFVYWFEKAWYFLKVENGLYFLDGKLASLSKLNEKDDKGRLLPLTAGGIKTIPSGLFPKNTPNFEPGEPFAPLTTPTTTTFPAIEQIEDEPSKEPEPEQSLITITEGFQTLEVSPLMATTTLSTTTTAPSHPVFTSTTGIDSTPDATDPIDVMELLRRALRQDPPSGGSGGAGGAGGAGGGAGGLAAQNPVPPAAAGDLKTVGQLPAIFDGDRLKADKFIEELKAYYRVNRDVAGFNSPIRKVALALTLMQGPQV